MNKVFRIATGMLVSAVAFTTLSSCSDDNKSGDDPIEIVDNKVSSEAEKFVGYWRNQTSKGYDFAFFKDGTCMAFEKGQYYTRGTGYWNYNPETNILATNISGWQWTITLFAEEAWTGISLGTGSIADFKKGDDADAFLAMLTDTDWTDKNGNTIRISSSMTAVGRDRDQIAANISLNFDLLDDEGKVADQVAGKPLYVDMHYLQHTHSDFILNSPIALMNRSTSWYQTNYDYLDTRNFGIRSNGFVQIELKNPFDGAKSYIECSRAIEGKFYRPSEK